MMYLCHLCFSSSAILYHLLVGFYCGLSLHYSQLPIGPYRENRKRFWRLIITLECEVSDFECKLVLSFHCCSKTVGLVVQSDEQWSTTPIRWLALQIAKGKAGMMSYTTKHRSHWTTNYAFPSFDLCSVFVWCWHICIRWLCRFTCGDVQGGP